MLIPWLVPPVVNGFLWGWLLNGEYGAFNGLLYELGLINDYVFWLRDPSTQVVWVAVVQTWTRFAFPMIVLLAGLQGIPDELYDAAKVDGANVLARLRHITLPSLRPSIAIVLVIEFIAAFQILRRRLDADLRRLDRRRRSTRSRRRSWSSTTSSSSATCGSGSGLHSPTSC